MGAGTSTWGQHDALVQPDGTITMFDDGAGPPTVHPFSRGIRVAVDTRTVTTRLLTVYRHSPQISANFEGGVQTLSGRDVFLGWGQQPYFSEDDASGRQIFDAHFAEPTTTYRAYRLSWSAQPPTQPALVSSLQRNGSVGLYASWNGATDVAAWRVLAGGSRATLTATGRSARNGFETALVPHSPGPYFEVQPLAADGTPLAASAVGRRGSPGDLRVKRVRVLGRGRRDPDRVRGPKPCTVTATVSSGGSSVARSGRVTIQPGDGAIVHFALSAAGRGMLAAAPENRLAVTVRASGRSVRAATGAVTLVRFGTTGRGPSRSATPSATLRIVGGTHFVSSRGSEGSSAACRRGRPVPDDGDHLRRRHDDRPNAHRARGRARPRLRDLRPERPRSGDAHPRPRQPAARDGDACRPRGPTRPPPSPWFDSRSTPSRVEELLADDRDVVGRFPSSPMLWPPATAPPCPALIEFSSPPRIDQRVGCPGCRSHRRRS